MKIYEHVLMHTYRLQHNDNHLYAESTGVPNRLSINKLISICKVNYSITSVKALEFFFRLVRLWTDQQQNVGRL